MKVNQSPLAQANEAFRKKDYDNALRLYLGAQKLYPELKAIIDKNIENTRKHIVKATPKHSDTGKTSIDIVVPVYNALDDVKKCLASLSESTDGFKVNIIVVNDGSDESTTQWLRDFCKNKPLFTLIENSKNLGYTKTVNVGLKASIADYVITQNSDTIVSKGWLLGLVNCITSDPKIGICGPLSNAASWQNVPDLYDETRKFAVNEIPHDFTIAQMAQVVKEVSLKTYPQLPFVNGFCFMIKREVLNGVGYMDEENFPIGYGEENDFCIRAQDAGYKLAIADDVYVYHAKSKSFGHEKRQQLSANGTAKLKEKHGEEKYGDLVNKVKITDQLDKIRARIKTRLNTFPVVSLTAKETKLSDIRNPLSKRILFLLPVSSGGGGVHSIVQETMGMRRIGVEAKIAVQKKYRQKYINNYKDIDMVEDLFLGYETDELKQLSREFDVIIGTIYTSMKLVKEVAEANPDIQPAYYIQDYEPLFSETGSPAWQEARDSYTLVPNAILFAKTDWICQKVHEEHAVQVRKVSPSIDHDVYKPDPYAKLSKGLEDKIVISAMIRPKTPRRGAGRTMILLKRLYEHFGDKLHIELFGCDENDPLFQQLERGFKYNNNGELTRLGVAAVLQRSDCFIDLSDYQAFGRTGLEAMACNATLIITKFGGISEYAVDNVNCILVDPFNEYETSKKVIEFLKNAALQNFKLESLLKASQYNIHRAAITELIILK